LKSTRDKNSFYASIARIAFILYIFFIFFGTALPFREKITEVDDIASSNVVNQVVFSGVFVLSSISLIPKRKELIKLCKREKFMTLFFGWCLLSLFWSDFSFVSFKRLFQVFTAFIVIAAELLHSESADEIIKYFAYILGGYLVISIVSVIVIPGAMDVKNDAWRGLATSKNHLGQVSLVNLIFWLHAGYVGVGTQKKISALMAFISLVLLVGSQSATAIITFIVISCIWMLMTVDNRLRPLNIGRLFFFLTTATLVISATLVVWLQPDIIIAIPTYFGKDITFTGRTDLWAEILERIKNHLFLGCGYAGFWVVDNSDLMQIYDQFVWLPRQAHNGYLDILNETGLIGFGIFAAMVVYYFKTLIGFGKPHFWKYFIIAALIINLQETTLFRQNIITGALFIFAYLILFWETLQPDAAAAPDMSI
jgi:exopolysaccharide production protein ExoQ